MTQRVLVISECFGLGHERAAEALIKGLETINPEVEVLHTNSIQRSFPRLKNPFLKAYLQLINRFPHTWHKLYENSRLNLENGVSKKAIHWLLSGALKKAINEFRPHAIVCTHPFPASVISRFKREGLEVPLVGIITDYDIHALWLDQDIDLYIVGHGKLESGFAAHNFTPRLVSGEGIPIDPVFAQGVDRAGIRNKFGLNDGRRMILVAGGGWGLGSLGRITELLSTMPENYKVVVVTGTNAELNKKLKHIFAHSANVAVEGLVKNMHEYILASDIIVTKPGGLTTSESLAAGVPMVLFDVLYGQEVWNANFVTEHGAAVKCGFVEEIPVKVREIMSNAAQYKTLVEKSLSLGKPSSGINAARNVLSFAK